MDTLLVPSSMQRIRAFLVEMCGMKVKPWASAEETLAALHATLTARQSCDIFWSALRTLLETLARDLKARHDAGPGTLVDNEVLSDERYVALLEEIRTTLARQTGEPDEGTFRRLAQGLSAPALALLLLLGGVTTTVGCESASMHSAPDAAVTDAQPVQADNAPDDTARIVLLDGPFVVGPDLKAPVRDGNAASTGPDGAAVTVKDIMESCNLPGETQGMVLACLAALNDSWKTGIADILAGKDCGTVASTFSFCGSGGNRCNTYLPKDFDPEQLRICEPALVYLGVRFV